MSVILPVFNSEAYLSLSLGSLLLQDFRDFEVIAVDDGSTDASLSILDRIAAKDSRVRVLDRPHQGLIASLNQALEVAGGEYIARMDADDIAYPQRFTRQLETFAADPALALCGTGFDFIHSGSRALPARTPQPTDSRGLQVLARFQAPLRHPTVMFRHSAIPDGMLRYDPGYPCAEDFDLFRRLAEETRLARLAEPLLAYRVHDTSVTATRPAQMYRTHARILEQNIARHYPAAAGTGFARLIDEVTEGTVAAGAELIRRLDALEPSQPAEDRAAFRLGTASAFYFLLLQIYRGNRLDLASDFIAQCESADRISWQRRLLLGGAAAAPALARRASGALPAVSHLVRTLRSQPIGRVVPGYASLLRQVAEDAPATAPDASAETRPDGAPAEWGDAADGRVIFVQPALPAYRLDYFDRLARHLGPRVRVYHSVRDMGVLTSGPRRPWAEPLGLMRDLPGGAEWQDGAMGIPVRRGDVLVVTGAPRCLSTLGLIAKARLRGARVLWWGHYWSATTRPWRHNLRLQIMRLADAQVLYTDAELAEYRDKLGRDPGPNVSALNNGIDTDPIARHRAPYAAAARERAVFFVGRLEAKAQLDLLLRALARPESGGLALHVLGDGTEGESLRALAGELGLEDRVHWHGGSTDEARISAVANRCRLFCYPGGVGLSLIHAMAYGLPAVVHSDRWTHMPEIAAFRDGVTGESFPPGDEGALARVLGGLADDLPALDAMSRAALATTEASFNTADMARRFALAIRRLRESPA